jgi:hypothetical protein
MWVAALGQMLTETSYREIVTGTSRALSGHSYVAAILEIRALSVSRTRVEEVDQSPMNNTPCKTIYLECAMIVWKVRQKFPGSENFWGVRP